MAAGIERNDVHGIIFQINVNDPGFQKGQSSYKPKCAQSQVQENHFGQYHQYPCQQSPTAWKTLNIKLECKQILRKNCKINIPCNFLIT